MIPIKATLVSIFIPPKEKEAVGQPLFKFDVESLMFDVTGFKFKSHRLKHHTSNLKH
ncbi:hypothetical protein I3300191I4_00510 [Megasphaera elsdenii]